MANIFIHSAKYLISVKLLTKNISAIGLTETNQRLAWDKPRQLATSPQTGFCPQFNTTPLSSPVPRLVLDEENLNGRFEIKPNFSKLEILINNFLLILFTIIAGIIASCVSLSFLGFQIKSYYRKISLKLATLI